MTTTALLPTSLSTTWEAPAPVLFNAWKHHAGFLRQRIRAAAQGDAGLDELAPHLVVVGAKLMDLYTGSLTPRDIGQQLLDQLRAAGHLEVAAMRSWLSANGDYATTTIDDGSVWVLRLGEEDGRYLHVHPARWTPRTVRVRANVLQTAVLALTHAAIHGGDPTDLGCVNAVRTKYLKLAPLGRPLSEDEGLGAILTILRSEA
jgi:hypothetical protein